MDYCAAFDVCVCCYKGFELVIASGFLTLLNIVRPNLLTTSLRLINRCQYFHSSLSRSNVFLFKELYAMNWNPKPVTCITDLEILSCVCFTRPMHEPKALHVRACCGCPCFACCQAEPFSAKYFEPPVDFGVWWAGGRRTPSDPLVYDSARPNSWEINNFLIFNILID